MLQHLAANRANDRRRIVVEMVHDAEREREIGALYEPLGRRITALVGQYDAAERATLLDFLIKASAVLEAETTSLRQGSTELRSVLVRQVDPEAYS